ncbi:MAG: uncharacterized protein A8A55_0092 [Amphiamblys sp. WSBS2006]|nr:MAG: uncharacterized protein A8A55_0092 [Amphiamblys sp. WSBS2006]
MENEILSLKTHPHHTNLVFFGGTENKLCLLDTQTGTVRELDVFEDSILSIKIHSALVLIVCSFRELKTYDCTDMATEEPPLLSSFVFEDDVEWCELCQNKIITGHKDASVAVIDLQSSNLEFLYGDGNMLTGCSVLSPDNNVRILASSSGGTTFVWAEDPPRQLAKYTDQKRRVAISADIHPNGQIAVLGYEDGSVAVFHMERGKIVQELPKHTDSVERVSFFGLGDREGVVSCCLGGEINVSWLNAKRPAKKYTIPSGISVMAAAENGVFYVGCIEGSVHKLDIKNGVLLKIRDETGTPILSVELTQNTILLGTDTVEELKLH